MEQTLGRKLSNNEVAYAVHRSRARKLKGISTAEVRERQQAQLSADELRPLRTLAGSVQPRRTTPPAGCEQEALTYAVGHVFERQSVVPEHELLAAALLHSQGEVDLQRAKRAVRQTSELVPTERGLSTRKILETELSLIQAVDGGRDAVVPLHPDYQPSAWLGEDQRRAILHVLESLIRSFQDQIKSIAARSLKPRSDTPIRDLDLLEMIWDLRGDDFITISKGRQIGFEREIDRYLGRKVDHPFGIGRIARMKKGFGVRLRLLCGGDGCRQSVTVFARPGLHSEAFAYVYDAEGNLLTNLRDEYVICASCRGGAD